MEYLLGKTTDKAERAYLINHFLDQFKGTIYRCIPHVRRVRSEHHRKMVGRGVDPDG